MDWNDDGDLDLYVANDATPNFLYTNRGEGTFAEEALALGVAYDADGRPEGSMGLAAGDWDNDGDLDLAVSNYEGQTATLHRNDGRAFANISFAAGVARTTLMPLQWGTAFFRLGPRWRSGHLHCQRPRHCGPRGLFSAVELRPEE